MFSLRCIDWVGAFMRTEFLCISVLRVASGPRVKLASCKSALNPPVVYSTDRSMAVVLVLVLLFVALWVILRGDLFYVLPCVFCSCVFFSSFSIAITSLGEERANLSAFRTLFDLCLFGFVGFLFLSGSGKGCGLWLWHSLDFSLTFFWKMVLDGYLTLFTLNLNFLKFKQTVQTLIRRRFCQCSSSGFRDNPLYKALWRRSDKNSADINNRYLDFVQTRGLISLVNDNHMDNNLMVFWCMHTMKRSKNICNLFYGS